MKLDQDNKKCWNRLWRHSVLGMLAMFLSLAVCSQGAEKASRDRVIRFSESTAIRSADGGQTWRLAEGTVEEVPYWAKSWLANDGIAPATQWRPQSVSVELENGAVIRRSAGANEWESDPAERATLPYWARLWLEEAPIRLPDLLPEIPVQSLCSGEKPLQHTQNLQVGPDLAIRSFDGGRTWAMAQGNPEDLPDWAAAWLNQPVVEVLPAKELVFGDALIRSVDGGSSWTLVRGKMADLPDWVRPWLGEAYPATDQPATARGAESTLPEGFELFPNPSQGGVTLRFELERPQEVRVLLYDLQGRLLQEIQSGNLPAGSRELSFSVAGLAAGPYFLQFNAEDRQERIHLLRSR